MSTPKPLCRLTEVKDTAELIGSFLKAPDLASLCQASKNSQLLFSKHLPEMALLKAVFDADPKRVKEILDKPRFPRAKCIILTKTHIKETYFSQKMNKRGVKRDWNNISPLEAAAWCGDIFLVRELLLYVLITQKQKAANQLKGILERKESEENGTFLAPYRELIKAYEIHHKQFDSFYAEGNKDELNKIWHEVWEKQRLLPTYGLQEYCDVKSFTHFPRPDFIEPPKRSCNLYDDVDHPLDLDAMDYDSALYKGGKEMFYVYPLKGNSYTLRWPGWRLYGPYAMNQLCEVRMSDLKNIIQELEEPKLSEEASLAEQDKDTPSRY